MKKIFIILGIGIILLMTLGVFADDIDSIAGNLEAEGKEVVNVIEVDPDNLPPQVNIEDIEFGANLAIYEIDIGEEKPIFAITASGEMFQETPVTEICLSRMFLHFGFDGEMIGPGFLQTATGVEGNLEKGYVMMRFGSITGISTILEINETSSEKIEIIIYKNGKSIGFRNTLNAVSSGTQKDYDLQSENIVTFNPGDIISVSAETSEGVILKDITTMIEITV